MNRDALERAIALEEAGDWKAAHGLVNDDERDPLAMWVHAWLHRIEGDDPNAGYWYRRAGRARYEGSTRDERLALLVAIRALPPETASR